MGRGKGLLHAFCALQALLFSDSTLYLCTAQSLSCQPLPWRYEIYQTPCVNTNITYITSTQNLQALSYKQSDLSGRLIPSQAFDLRVGLGLS